MGSRSRAGGYFSLLFFQSQSCRLDRIGYFLKIIHFFLHYLVVVGVREEKSDFLGEYLSVTPGGLLWWDTGEYLSVTPVFCRGRRYPLCWFVREKSDFLGEYLSVTPEELLWWI